MVIGRCHGINLRNKDKRQWELKETN
jgi:hypothetical protein